MSYTTSYTDERGKRQVVHLEGPSLWDSIQNGMSEEECREALQILSFDHHRIMSLQTAMSYACERRGKEGA